MARNEFICLNCRNRVSMSRYAGTSHRNHCPFCLWSRHVDENQSGDRQSTCRANMAPIGLTFKKAGKDKWGKPKQGELMIIHRCVSCGKIIINRIAGDDSTEATLEVYKQSQSLGKDIQQKLQAEDIRLLDESDRQEIQTQLFGKK